MGNVVPERVGVAIAGGSIAGLCAGNALLAANHDVHIFEQSASRLTSRGAGIVVQPDLTSLLSRADAPPLAMTSCSVRKTYAGTSRCAQTQRMPQSFTSWEAIYASLIGAFPSERYHSGDALEIGKVAPGRVTATTGNKTIHADLLVAADGFRSKARLAFAPETISRYAGYIAWRGVIDEADLPKELVAFFDDTFAFCEAEDGGHALCYLIPGEGGSTEPGTRRLNWVWYVTIPEGDDFEAVMTDKNGNRREAAVAAGQVNETAIADLHRRTELLDPHFANLIKTTPEPFIQSIIDVAPPEMAFGRVCLLGDAAFVVRPHTAAATAKAASDASALARALGEYAPDIDRALHTWNREQVAAGRRLVNYGVMLGERSTQKTSR